MEQVRKSDNQRISEYEISGGILQKALDEERIFTWEELHEEILQAGGVGILGTGRHVSERLKELVFQKVLYFEEHTKKYYPFAKNPEKPRLIPFDKLSSSALW